MDSSEMNCPRKTDIFYGFLHKKVPVVLLVENHLLWLCDFPTVLHVLILKEKNIFAIFV